MSQGQYILTAHDQQDVDADIYTSGVTHSNSNNTSENQTMNGLFEKAESLFEHEGNPKEDTTQQVPLTDIRKVEVRIKRIEKSLIGLKQKLRNKIIGFSAFIVVILGALISLMTGLTLWHHQDIENQRQAHALTLLLLDKVSSDQSDQWLRKKNLNLLAQSTEQETIKLWALEEEKQVSDQSLPKLETRSHPTQLKLSWPLGHGAPKANQIIYEPFRQGISIEASLGDPIVAAEDGRVLYSSNELPKYGNLIILEHQRGLISIYGHNYANYVEKGDFVHRGQLIGVTGELPNTKPGLYFEIRQQGNAENPLLYLSPLQSNY